MISTQASQAMLVRNTLKGAVSVSRAARSSRVARLVSAPEQIVSPTTFSPSKRNFFTSSQKLEAAPVNSSTATIQVRSVPSRPAAQAAKSVPTKGRKHKRRGRPVTVADKANLLIKWNWFEADDARRSELASIVSRTDWKEASYPEWVESTFSLAKSFRSARGRRWIPTLEEIQAVSGSEVSDVQAWLEETIGSRKSTSFSNSMDREERIDVALRPVWQNMTAEQREAAMIRVRFDCIRKLGWRQGYSSGYPKPGQEPSSLPAGLGRQGEEGWAAFKELQRKESELAWQAWQELTPEHRTAEEKAAWRLRDRSQIYLDDSEDSRILGAMAPRWYAEPERAGQLIFLPNTIIRLVKNHTPAGQEYDPWKATFRVPLSMHKHALRTYLLSIYGLKTTWARSLIYRSPVSRDMRTGKKITGKGRTYKKVEVGLLEPFLFPEISPDFQKRHLMTSELDYERSRVYLKMTKTTRWRGRKSVEQYEEAHKNRESTQYHGFDPNSSEGIKEDDRIEDSKFPRFMVRTKGLPSAKHGRILKLLGDERKQKEERINALVQKFKEDMKAQQLSETENKA